MQFANWLRLMVSVLCLGGSAASATLGLAILLLQLKGCALVEGRCPKCNDCEQVTSSGGPTCGPLDPTDPMAQCPASSTCEAKPGSTANCGCRRTEANGVFTCLCRIP